MIASYYCPAADGNKECKKPNPVACQASMDYHAAINYSEVDFAGVNSVIVSCDDDYNLQIIQTSGYTPERGTFIDEY